MVLKLMYGLTVDNELTVLWGNTHKEAEGSLPGCKCVTGCTTKRNRTQCSVGHISCMNMPETEGREYIDLPEMVLGETVCLKDDVTLQINLL